MLGGTKNRRGGITGWRKNDTGEITESALKHSAAILVVKSARTKRAGSRTSLGGGGASRKRSTGATTAPGLGGRAAIDPITKSARTKRGGSRTSHGGANVTMRNATGAITEPGLSVS